MREKETRSDPTSCKCSVCRVHGESDWFTLGEKDLQDLSRAVRRRNWLAGQALFRMGDSNRGVHCISEGLVALRKFNPQGDFVLLAIAGPGDTIGYRAYLSGEAHHTSAEALGPCSACFIPRDLVSSLLERNPALGIRFMRRALRDLDAAQDNVVQQVTLSNRERLVHLLLVLLQRTGETAPDGSRQMLLPLSRIDMASMIGTRHETLSRIMGRLEHEGLAKFSGRHVHVPSVRALADELHERLDA